MLSGCGLKVAIQDGVKSLMGAPSALAGGILSRAGSANSGDELENTYTVVAYTDNPATLGIWPG